LKSDGELIVAKQRSGETGTFPINYDRLTLTFGKAEFAGNQRMEGVLMASATTATRTRIKTRTTTKTATAMEVTIATMAAQPAVVAATRLVAEVPPRLP
jgi:hypothetical protein